MGKTLANNTLTTKKDTYDLTKPTDVLEFANMLKGLIVEQRLYANIRGKNYPLVEAWQIAGAFTGTFPIVESVENLSDDKTYKYRAEVSLRDKDGNKVGYGVAICTNKEAGKTAFDEYAVASMAQTRAVGKAFRMKIGWLLKVAGYETTPAEEMDAVAAEVVETPKPSRLDFKAVREKLTEITDLDALEQYWRSLNLSEAQASVLQHDFAARKFELRFKQPKEQE